MAAIPFSVLDLSPVLAGETPREALAHSVALARHAEALGYERFWLAEHHNMPGIASAATAVVIGHVAGATSTIRVGSGGIMLPNHSPLVIAEQFGTLASLYSGRIDLGLGRAPGGDGHTLRALRRMPDTADRFPRDVQELQHLFGHVEEGQPLRAVPGAGLEVPIYLLGSSTFSGRTRRTARPAVRFRSTFRPRCARGGAGALPRSLPAFGAAGRTARDRRRHGRRGRHRRGGTAAFYPRCSRPSSACAAARRACCSRRSTTSLPLPRGRNWPASTTRCAMRWWALPSTVEHGLAKLLAETEADELLVTAQIYDQEARRRSFSLVADVRDRLGERRAAA